LEEFLSDPSKVRNLFDATGTPKPEFTTLLKNYATTVHNRNDEIGKQVKEQVQATIAEMFRDDKDARRETARKVNLDPTFGIRDLPTQRGKIYNRHAIGAKNDKIFENSETPTADFFRMITRNAVQNATPEELPIYRALKNYSSDIPSDGGFLIPETLRANLLSVALESSVVRPRAFVVPMESLRVPFPTVDETTHVGSVFGGLVGRWTPEGTEATDDTAKFGVVTLEAGRLEIYCEVPDTLVNDSAISFDAYLAGKMPEAMAFYEDRAFLKGNGAGQPLGALNASAMIQVAKQTGQAADTIVWQNIVKMYARMLPSSLMRAVWVVSPDTFPELATMALSVGTGGAAVWLPDGTGTPQMTLLGRPVVVTEKAEVLGDAGDINFIDFGYYLIGDRQAMSSTSSEHFKFSSSKIAYKVIERVDGRPWIASAITPENGGSTLSPFVQIAARA
jgi:HK97 family phage major capsid protein